jgi:hypothetical protein
VIEDRRRPVVIGVLFERDVIVLDVFLQLVRSGADEVMGEIVAILLDRRR